MSFVNGPNKAELMLCADGMVNKTFEMTQKSRDAWFEKNIHNKGHLTDVLMSGYIWKRSGFPSVSLGHKHAASLVAMKLPKEYAADVRMPWSMFWIDVPDGIISALATQSDKGGYRNTFVRGLLVGNDPESGRFRIQICDDMAWIRQSFASPGQLSCDVESTTNLDVHGMPVESDAMTRSLECIGRLVVGVAIEMTVQFGDRIERCNGNSVKKDHRGNPETNTFTLTRDVKVDCRKIIREYIAGSGFSPSVQCLTRGHWRFQPYGPGREKRKWLFIEPYWRGPEDAPVAVRSHVIVDHMGNPVS